MTNVSHSYISSAINLQVIKVYRFLPSRMLLSFFEKKRLKLYLIGRLAFQMLKDKNYNTAYKLIAALNINREHCL